MLIKNGIPQLRSGTILDKEVLEYMRDNGYKNWVIYYKNKCNGIMEGVELLAENDNLIIKSGTIKYRDAIYTIKEDLRVNIPKEDGDFIIKIRFYEEVEDSKYKYMSYEIIIDVEKKTENEIELGRIKRREGAEVRNISKFQGQDKEYNQINILNKVQGTKTGESLPFELLSFFADEMLNKKELESDDLVICSNILSQTLERKILNYYLGNKLSIDSTDYSTWELYESLEQVLERAKDKPWKSSNKKKVRGLMFVE